MGERELAPSALSEGDASAVRQEHSGDFLRLLRLWRRDSQFSLNFAAVDSAVYRDALIARLDAAAAVRIDLAADYTPLILLERLHAAHAGGALRAHVCLPTREPLDAAWWRHANVLRERLAEAFPAMLLVWLGDADLDAVAHQAPDLWNWRDTVFTFTAPAPLALPKLAGEYFSDSSDAVAADVERRLKEIERYLAEIDDDGVIVAHLQYEAAGAYRRLGLWDKSESAAYDAARRFAHAGNSALAALARIRIADILQERGRFDDALTIYENDVLPVFERLGDMYLAAITKGRIADVLQRQGRLDEALAIHENDQIPAFERLGDVRAVAFTKGKIADVLLVRGRLDEARAIYENDLLPVFERFGDLRMATLTKGRIAIILQARGRFNDALAIYENDELPVYERLGDVHAVAVTKGRIADILRAQGRLDEALAIYETDQLPIYERLCDMRAAAIVKAKIADIQQARSRRDAAFINGKPNDSSRQ